MQHPGVAARPSWPPLLSSFASPSNAAPCARGQCQVPLASLRLAVHGIPQCPHPHTARSAAAPNASCPQDPCDNALHAPTAHVPHVTSRQLRIVLIHPPTQPPAPVACKTSPAEYSPRPLPGRNPWGLAAASSVQRLPVLPGRSLRTAAQRYRGREMDT